MQKLQACSPDMLVFLGGYLGFEFSEIKLHNMFKQSRLHGEWFSPAKEITDFIENYCLSNPTSLYYAHHEIEKGRMSYEEALALGNEELCKRSDVQFLGIVEKMYTKNGRNILAK
jgi:hypothetical protein